jgi:hypothetical protein
MDCKMNKYHFNIGHFKAIKKRRSWRIGKLLTLNSNVRGFDLTGVKLLYPFSFFDHFWSLYNFFHFYLNFFKVSASKLPHNEWDSVFWNDLFSRPDIETSYLENTFTYDQGKDRFIYSSKKEEEFFGHLQDKLNETTFFAILSYYIKRVMFVYMYRHLGNA